MSVLKPIHAIRREWSVFTDTLRSAAIRELLLWCLPALLLGAIARLALNFHFSYGYFQGDTPDFLVTAERLLRHHALVIHGKKAFLAPICFTIPFLLRLPALIVIPIVQHLAGLAATVAAGGIVRCWFRFWRGFIIPVTTLYTLNPALLWYEHALLAECHYLFCVTALALAGTLLVRRPTLRRFVWLIVALFFTAGSRPEGKLFIAFGIGVTALVYLGDWKLWARRMAVMLVCSAGIWMCSRSTQAGLLLYATVLPLAPDVSTVAPGVEPFVASLRVAGASQGETVRTKLNSVEKHANDALRGYLKSVGKNNDDAHVSALAQKLAIEAIRRNPRLLPSIAANKFLVTCRPNPDGSFSPTSGGFTAFWIYDKQIEALARRKFMAPLMKGLTGQNLRTDADIKAFLHANYSPLSPDWFSLLQSTWSQLTLSLQHPSHGADKRFIPGWPSFCLVAGLGMLLALIPRDRLWRFHLPWVMAFLGVWFAVMLTGVVNARYRFVFEPFCLFYGFLVLDFLWSGVAALINVPRERRPAPLPPAVLPSAHS
jgi:hypothetical protein